MRKLAYLLLFPIVYFASCGTLNKLEQSEFIENNKAQNEINFEKNYSYIPSIPARDTLPSGLEYQVNNFDPATNEKSTDWSGEVYLLTYAREGKVYTAFFDDDLDKKIDAASVFVKDKKGNWKASDFFWDSDPTMMHFFQEKYDILQEELEEINSDYN